MLRTNKIKYWILPTCHTLGHEIFLAGPPPERNTCREFHMFKKMYRVFKTIYSEYFLGGSLWWKIARIIGPDWFIMEVLLFYLWVLEASRQFKGWLAILRTHFKGSTWKLEPLAFDVSAISESRVNPSEKLISCGIKQLSLIYEFKLFIKIYKWRVSDP